MAPFAAMVSIAAVASACASGLRAGAGPPDAAVAAGAVDATAPDRPLRAVFDWRIAEGEARAAGRGAARIAPEYRARLDLFGPRGESVLSAALVRHDVLLPALREPVPLPEPSLMWAVLGTVLPPADAELASTATEGAAVRLDYRAAGARWTYHLAEGRLRRAVWETGGRTRTVELADAAGPLPRRALYRDPSAQVEILLIVDEVADVEPFSPDIWTPGR